MQKGFGFVCLCLAQASPYFDDNENVVVEVIDGNWRIEGIKAK
jgi:hypothetical protein